MMPLSLLLKATGVLVVTLLATWMARRSRAALRHLLLGACFAMLLLLPVAASFAPALTVAVPRTLDTTLVPLDADPVVEFQEVQSERPASHRSPEPVANGWQLPSVAEVLAVFWIAGAVVLLLPLAVGFVRVRALRRTSVPWRQGQIMVDGLRANSGLTRRIEVLLHDKLPGPMTCGVIRPAIVLPVDAREWADTDLHRALVHELEHVRRFDWLTLCAARVIAAIYWFHPIVWIVWRRFGLEAERACDDAVLCGPQASASDGDETAYADQLVHLAQRLSGTASEIPLAMANRKDLSARVAAVLDQRRPRGRAGRAAVFASAFAAALFVAAVSPFRLVAKPLTPTQERPRFEIASVKPCAQEEAAPAGTGRQGGVGSLPVSADRVIIPCLTPERLIAMAYVTNGEALENNRPIAAIDNRSQWIKGLPGWAKSERFTIEGKADRAVDRKILQGPMLAALLEDRFKLKLHRDVEDGPMYALTVAERGLKIQPETCTPVTEQPIGGPSYVDAVLKGGKPSCGSFTMVGGTIPGNRRWVIGGATMAGFAGILSGALDRQVLNRTGVDGLFNFRLEFMPDEHTRSRAGISLPGEQPSGGGPNIFAAVDQYLGLKLEPVKAPRGFIVVDRIERPGPDIDNAGQDNDHQIPLADGSSLTQVKSPTRFEVASIKPCLAEEDLQAGRARGGAGGTNATTSPGRFSVPCVTLEQLVYLAYASYGAREDERLMNDYMGTASDPTKVRGGPDWVHSHRDKWAIEATAPGVTDRYVLMGTMLRTLLEERFKLKLRRASETAPMYALRVAQDGFKLKALTDGDCDASPNRVFPPQVSPSGKQPCGYMTNSRAGGTDSVHFVGFPIGFLARRLAEVLKLHVIDETGIAGDFIIDLRFRSDDLAASGGARVESTNAPSVFTALEQQLGLKLEKTTGSRGYLVIEHAERPAPDRGPAGHARQR